MLRWICKGEQDDKDIGGRSEAGCCGTSFVCFSRQERLHKLSPDYVGKETAGKSLAGADHMSELN